jgi:VCBS repeat protein
MRLLIVGIAVCLVPFNLFGFQPVYTNAARFAEHTIATDLNGGYQVVVSDINHDGKPDLIAVASGMKELIWFENPGWQRHVIVGNISRPINCAAWDLDGDGIPEIALAHEFANDPARSIGIVSLLKHKAILHNRGR